MKKVEAKGAAPEAAQVIAKGSDGQREENTTKSQSVIACKQVESYKS